MFDVCEDSALSLEVCGLTRSNAYNKLKGTEYKVIKIDGKECVTKEVARVLFQGETYVKEGSGKGAKWVKERGKPRGP